MDGAEVMASYEADTANFACRSTGQKKLTLRHAWVSDARTDALALFAGGKNLRPAA